METTADYNAFVALVVNALPDFMPEDFSGTIEARQVDKLQGESYYGVAIQPDNSSVGISLNLHLAFDAWQDGTTLTQILHQLADSADKNLRDADVPSADYLRNYSEMRPHLMLQAIPTSGNEDILATIPHQSFEDISIVYRLMLDEIDGKTAMVLITNTIMDGYGITSDQLFEDAMEYSPANFPISVRSMQEVLSEMAGMPMPVDTEPDLNPLYVVTCNDGMLGSGSMFYPDFTDAIAEKVDGNFYVLPSSIHEVLVLAESDGISLQELQSMVRDINETEVAPADRLSDTVYHYDTETMAFEKAEDYVARKQKEKEQTPGNESALKKLKEKSAIVAVQEAGRNNVSRDQNMTI